MAWAVKIPELGLSLESKSRQQPLPQRSEQRRVASSSDARLLLLASICRSALAALVRFASFHGAARTSSRLINLKRRFSGDVRCSVPDRPTGIELGKIDMARQAAEDLTSLLSSAAKPCSMLPVSRFREQGPSLPRPGRGVSKTSLSVHRSHRGSIQASDR